ncbi:MAG: hypothetical protein ACRD9Y_23460, partial [Blastocatellia bacterium]
MTNRAIARRALFATLTLLSALTLLFSQTLFETYAKLRRQTTISSSIHSSGLSSTGQAARRNIGAVFDKLRAGKSVTIAYLGGSITAGAGATNPEKSSYRALTTEWFRKNYPKAEITELNAAINSSGASG